MKRVIVKIAAFIVRAVYLTIGLTFYYMDRAANWFIGFNKKAAYIRKGRCRRCGKCCQLLAVQYPKFFNRFQWLLRATIRWHEFRCNFTYQNSEGNYFLYRCNFIKPDGTCRIYHFRPRICREYPKMGLFGKPATYYDCGFYYARRDGMPTFDEALHRADEKLSK